jgi:ATP-dependent helicase/nuclease subunit B
LLDAGTFGDAQSKAALQQCLQQQLDQQFAAAKNAHFPDNEPLWDEGAASLAADLFEWLRLLLQDTQWQPAYFELAFGLGDEAARDAASATLPVRLANGLQLRGSVDLVERDSAGRLRATDYKTGKVRAKLGDVIAGGDVLQPAFYSLALTALFPDAQVVGTRLYYCSQAGQFTEVDFPADDASARSADAVVDVLRSLLAANAFVAAPADKACTYCDYRMVCGPHEEQRVARKASAHLKSLVALRLLP